MLLLVVLLVMQGKVVNLHSITSVSQRSVREDAETMCYHCGLAAPKQTRHYLMIDGVQQPMCCIGCVAVAELLVDSFETFEGNDKVVSS